MLTGSFHLFNTIFIFNIIAPLLIIIFFKQPWEKIPIFFGILILYIILSAWLLHLFCILKPYFWRIITISLFFPFLLGWWKYGSSLQLRLKKGIRLTFTNSIFFIFIIVWIGITYFRIGSLPTFLSDARTMHLFQQSVYFQEGEFAFHNSNTWESAFRPLNALLWNMFFSIFLEDNSLIEAPQLLSWVGLILISKAIFFQLKIDNRLTLLILLCIGFSPRILSLSTNNFIDLPSLFYFSGIIYFLIKLDKTKHTRIIDLIMLGTFCGAYLGSRTQGVVLVPLLLIYFMIIILNKRTSYSKTLLIPFFLTILLGTGKYFMNYYNYETPIPINLSDSTTLSFKKFYKNFAILINNTLDRSWNLYGVISFQANSAITGFLISFFIIPHAFFGILSKKYRQNLKSSPIFIIGLIFLLISMLSLESPSQNYPSRLWLPFIFTAIIFGADVLNALVKEKRTIIILFIFLVTIFLSTITYGGPYRKGFGVFLVIIALIFIKNKKNDVKFLLNIFSFIVFILSLWYLTANIIYDKSSQILNIDELNQKYNQKTLVKLSKYFSPKDKVGYFNLIKGKRIHIYDLLGHKHYIHGRLVFDWIDKRKVITCNDKDLKLDYDYLLVSKSKSDIPSKIDGFSFIERFDNYFIYKNILNIE